MSFLSCTTGITLSSDYAAWLPRVARETKRASSGVRGIELRCYRIVWSRTGAEAVTVDGLGLILFSFPELCSCVCMKSNLGILRGIICVMRRHSMVL